MYLSLRGHHIPFAHLFRDLAAICGAALAAGWLGLLVLEAIRSSQWIPNIQSYGQALVLAIVFASYAIGWRHALVGAALALAGTAVFFAAGYATTGAVPPLPAVWLALPGVLYLLAWVYGDRRHGTNLHIRRN
jgi:hypothetical protein